MKMTWHLRIHCLYNTDSLRLPRSSEPGGRRAPKYSLQHPWETLSFPVSAGQAFPWQNRGSWCFPYTSLTTTIIDRLWMSFFLTSAQISERSWMNCWIWGREERWQGWRFRTAWNGFCSVNSSCLSPLKGTFPMALNWSAEEEDWTFASPAQSKWDGSLGASL